MKAEKPQQPAVIEKKPAAAAHPELSKLSAAVLADASETAARIETEQAGAVIGRPPEEEPAFVPVKAGESITKPPRLKKQADALQPKRPAARFAEKSVPAGEPITVPLRPEPRPAAPEEMVGEAKTVTELPRPHAAAGLESAFEDWEIPAGAYEQPAVLEEDAIVVVGEPLVQLYFAPPDVEQPLPPAELEELSPQETALLEQWQASLETASLLEAENIAVRLEQLDPETQTAVYELAGNIILAGQRVLELRMEDDEAAPEAEQALWQQIEELLCALQIEPSDEAVRAFVRTLYSFVQEQQPAETDPVDEGTHERKTELNYLQQLVLLAKQSQPPHLRLGRLVCRQLVPAFG